MSLKKKVEDYDQSLCVLKQLIKRGSVSWEIIVAMIIRKMIINMLRRCHLARFRLKEELQPVPWNLRSMKSKWKAISRNKWLKRNSSKYRNKLKNILWMSITQISHLTGFQKMISLIPCFKKWLFIKNSSSWDNLCNLIPFSTNSA